jgi:MFS family permease
MGEAHAAAVDVPCRDGVLRGNPLFRRMWSAQTVSVFGDAITGIAVPTVAVLSLHASPIAVGALTSVSWAAWPLIGLPVGVWVDRLPRRPLLVGADLLRLVLIGSVPLAWAFGRLTFAQLLAVAALAGAATVVFDLTFTAALPDVVPPEDLADANGRLELSGSSSRLTGPGLAGVVISTVGAPAALICDVASFAASAFLLGTGPALHRRGETRERAPFVAEIREGVAALRRYVPVFRATFAAAISNFALSMGQGVFYVFAYRSAHLSPAAVGIALTVGSLGNIAGAAAAPRLSRLLTTGPALIVSTALEGTAVLLTPLALLGVPAVWIAVAFGWRNFFNPLWNVTAATMRQQLVPPDLQGRVTAGARAIGMSVTPLGGLVGGAIAAAASPAAALIVAGIVGGASVLPIASRRYVGSVNDSRSRG